MVDYGSKELVYIEDLKKLPQEYINLKSQCFYAQLNNVEMPNGVEKWPAKAKDMMETILLNNGTFFFAMFAASLTWPMVELYDMKDMNPSTKPEVVYFPLVKKGVLKLDH